MRLAQLRHQMLIAMGLPACWTQTSTPQPVQPSPVAPVEAPPPRREPEIAMFDVKTCTTDQIVETVCGRGSGEYCSGTAAGVEFSADGLYVTAYDLARASARDFILDDAASEAFVIRLQSMNERLDGKPGCCYSRCTSLVVGAAKPLPSPLPAYHMKQEHCVPAPAAGTSQPDQTNPACPQGVQLQGELRPYSGTRNDTCCYASVNRRVIIHKGRPARVDGEPRFAEIARGDSWHANIAVAVVELPAAVRARLAASWLAAAKMEHASIAAFNGTALRLLALGAPPALIAGCQRAALDEIEHARLAFALASAYAGEPLTAGGFDAAVRVGATTLRELAIETFVDGCIGETVAALEAERAAEAVRDPAVAAVLRTIAADEARHAELAWQIVAWCVQREPAIADALQAEAPAFDGPDDLDGLDDYGVLATTARRRAYEDVVREVVEPCVAALAA